MNRKLRNRFTALMACSLVLIPVLLLALVGTHPLLRPGLHGTDGITPPPSDDAAEQPAPAMTRRQRDSHQSLVTPFFSFAPRG